ncbi:MAG: RagB/SusD family nutrient uptake outer membrane protein [Sphingobacteriales bacterium]|nr:RagB/SusD family nutrient uptake outer membrane protein [Sphingobacteriales bacterium]
MLYAETMIHLNDNNEAVNTLNTIRVSHGLGAYSGGVTTDELINEMLKQRRYSLFAEGHRWIDMRRYGKLGELPIDRAEDDVWSAFPIPITEN